MKTVNEINKSRVPIVILDKSLDELNDVVLFPEKVAIAKETIDKIGLPKKRSTAANKSIAASGADTAQHQQ